MKLTALETPLAEVLLALACVTVGEMGQMVEKGMQELQKLERVILERAKAPVQ